ncbi:hypothetical protein [Clostridioides difficile]|uniref:hypothetical protein n=1 Tax=Clostridioides difficile TaxID=1496 RepID=UPI0010354A15|nr:hypothetical protein [Clostridioides difficile]MDM9943989.1 hypothetical protein [Clostridioides difficile]
MKVTEKYINANGNIRFMNNVTGEYVDLLLNKEKNLYKISIPGSTQMIKSMQPIDKAIRIAKNFLDKNSFYSHIENYLKKVLNVTDIERLSDRPNNHWRHCCNSLEIGTFKPKYITLDGYNISYIQCSYCNTVIYYINNYK